MKRQLQVKYEHTVVLACLRDVDVLIDRNGVMGGRLKGSKAEIHDC